MDNRDAVIALQSRRIAELCGRLEAVTGERDVLLLELQQLRCQLQLRELTSGRLRSVTDTPHRQTAAGNRDTAAADRPAGATGRSSSTGWAHFGNKLSPSQIRPNKYVEIRIAGCVRRRH